MTSNETSPTTVAEYLDRLPAERRDVVAAVRDVVVRNLPVGYRETLAWGMITWVIPLERYPDTYNGHPLGYVSLAAQKNYYALYLMGCYMDPEQDRRLRESFALAAKKLDMGKSCVRFRKLEDLPLEAIGQIVASMPPDAYIARYEANRK